MNKKTNSNQASTKKDIGRIEKFLKAGFRNLRKEILKVEARVENLEEGQKRLETKADNLEIKMDGFAGTVETLREENAAGAVQYRRHEARLDDHESRLATLEPH